MMRRLLVVLLFAAAVVLALLLDRPIAGFVARHPFAYSSDLNLMFRLAGFIPLWTVVAIAFALIDSREGWRGAGRRSGWLLGAVLIAGAAAEVFKLLVRRERPNAALSGYVFRPWTEPLFSSGGLGWPSSHTAVAFAAVLVLCRLHPRATVLWLAIGGLCAFSRLANNSHFASDIVGGVLTAYAVVAALWVLRKRVSPE